MPCQPCLSDGIWTAWNYLWQKYELFSTFFHYFPKFSTIFSTAQPCFFRSIKAFAATWVAVNRRPPGPSPSLTCTPSLRPSLHRSFAVHHFGHHFVDHFVPPLSTLPSSIICRPSLILHHFVITLSITSPPSRVLHHFVDHLLSITYPPSFVTFHHSPPGLTAF